MGTFNGIKGIEQVMAQFKGYASPEDMAKAEAKREKMRALAVKGGQARRRNEGTVALQMRAFKAGMREAREVAGWVARYIEGGTDFANKGPKGGAK
jgi:hypothetical protein